MNITKDPPGRKRAFSRLELAVVLGTIALLALIATSVLANDRSRSEQVVCLSNLRQIGHAFQLWASEHAEKAPWWTHISDGGSFQAPGDPTPPWLSSRGNVWFQFAWISNELSTPNILVCPSDAGVGSPRKIANDFSASPSGGFVNPSYKNNSVSYLIGLHSFFDFPRSVLSGDRNMRYDSGNVACSTGLGSTLAITTIDLNNPRWTNSIHGLAGNVVFTDGSVERFSNFDEVYRGLNFTDASDHFLAP